MSTPSGDAGINFFAGGSNLQFNRSNFLALNVHAPHGVPANTLENLRLLDAEVSPNAILNKGGRADEVRCYPGTREQVIRKIEKWMALGYTDDRRIFWLSGPAGAGKSAIVQTMAENCIRRKIAMANFFFFRADGSRCHSRPVVATLLHQLFKIAPDLKAVVNDIISEDRLIFKKPLRDQFLKLIDGPIRSIWGDRPPIVLLVDGLDECDSRAKLDLETKSEQTTVLNVLHEFVTPPDSPFIALVASRVESHIEMAFNTIGCAKSSIYLNKDYQPDDDIRRYVSGKLSRIKETHALRRHLNDMWPSPSSIDSIVQKSSGQFIYASTVIRFIAFSSQSPAISLEMVLNIRPVKRHSPFTAIDSIYSFVLSRCEDVECALDIISIQIFDRPGLFLPSSLGYSMHDVASIFANLTSIIEVDYDYVVLGISLKFYHASFRDFMVSASRAGKYHLDKTITINTLTPRLIRGIADHETFRLAMDFFNKYGIDNRSQPLTHALTHLPPKPWNIEWDYGDRKTVRDDFFRLIILKYSGTNPELYTQIFNHMKQQNWIPNELSLSEIEFSFRNRVNIPNIRQQVSAQPESHHSSAQQGNTRPRTLLSAERLDDIPYELSLNGEPENEVHELGDTEAVVTRQKWFHIKWVRYLMCK